MSMLDDNGRCKVSYQKDHSGKVTSWKCTRQLDTMLYPLEMNRCFFSNCPSISPMKEESVDAREKLVIKAACPRLKNCEWCGEEFIVDKKLKYCSKVCKNRYARKAYRDRQKLKNQRAESR